MTYRDPVHCLQPGCTAPAYCDEPVEHDSTGGPVLSWQVTCSGGHSFTDSTLPFGLEV